MKFSSLFEDTDDHEYFKSMPHEHLHAETHRALTSLGHDQTDHSEWDLARRTDAVDYQDEEHYTDYFDQKLHPHGWKGHIGDTVASALDVVRGRLGKTALIAHHPNGSYLGIKHVAEDPVKKGYPRGYRLRFLKPGEDV